MLNQCNEFAMSFFNFMYSYLPLWCLIGVTLGTIIVAGTIIKDVKKQWRKK